jgi:hypothetical protein
MPVVVNGGLLERTFCCPMSQSGRERPDGSLQSPPFAEHVNNPPYRAHNRVVSSASVNE